MTYLESFVVLVMEYKPALSLFLILTVLERVIHNHGKAVTRNSLVPDRIKVTFLDKNDAFLITWSLVSMKTETFGSLTRILVDKWDRVILSALLGKILLPIDSDLGGGELVRWNVDFVTFLDDTHVGGC